MRTYICIYLHACISHTVILTSQIMYACTMHIQHEMIFNQQVIYSTNHVKLKQYRRVFSCERVCLRIPHGATCVSNTIITNLHPLSINFMFPYPFCQSSAQMLNKDWLYRMHSAKVCKSMAMLYVSTYNVLFSTLNCLLTMIPQLNIHSATDSDNTHKRTQNFPFACAYVFCGLPTGPV